MNEGYQERISEVLRSLQQQQAFGQAGEWIYKFDLLQAEISDTEPDDEECDEYENRYISLEDEMFASAVQVEKIDDCGVDRSFLIFKDGSGMDWKSDGDYRVFNPERTAEIRASGFKLATDGEFLIFGEQVAFAALSLDQRAQLFRAIDEAETKHADAIRGLREKFGEDPVDFVLENRTRCTERRRA
jgi:hypothetical protein